MLAIGDTVYFCFLSLSCFDLFIFGIILAQLSVSVSLITMGHLLSYNTAFATTLSLNILSQVAYLV